MNHSLCSADRETHRRIIGSAFVAIIVVTMLGAAVIAKSEQQSPQSSVAVLRASIPVATIVPVLTNEGARARLDLRARRESSRHIRTAGTFLAQREMRPLLVACSHCQIVKLLTGFQLRDDPFGSLTPA
jgi:predicted permease